MWMEASQEPHSQHTRGTWSRTLSFDGNTFSDLLLPQGQPGCVWTECAQNQLRPSHGAGDAQLWKKVPAVGIVGASSPAAQRGCSGLPGSASSKAPDSPKVQG